MRLSRAEPHCRPIVDKDSRRPKEEFEPGSERSSMLNAADVRGTLHIQTINSRHSQIKAFLRRRRGIATK